MDLRFFIPRSPTPTRADAFHALPPPLRFAAIRDTIELAGSDEIEFLAIELIYLSNHEYAGPAGWVPAWFERIAGSLGAAPDRDASGLALRARRLLISHWPRLPASCRRLALGLQGVDWTPAVEDELGSGSDRALSAFLDDLAEPGLLPATTRLLASDDRSASDTAERLLLRLASRAIPTREGERPARARLEDAGEPPGLPLLVAALSDALRRQTEHERSGPALAALLLLDRPMNDADRGPLAPLARIVADADHPGFPVLRRLLRRDDSPATRRIAWRLLADGPMAMAALERLARSGGRAQHEAVLPHTHLLRRPGRARLVGLLATTPHVGPEARRSAAAAPLPQTTAGLSVRARRGLPRLLEAARAHPDLRTALHTEAIADPDEHTRLGFSRIAASTELVDFCFDASASVARSAALRFSGVGVGRAAMASRRLGLLSKLARSPHAPVRHIALTEPASRAWLSPAGRTRALAARRTEPDRLAGELRDAASAAGETRSRVDAIRLARRLRLLAGWEETLAGLIEAPPKEARVSATAASAIADLPGPYPADLLERALVHPDPRVRANAVEAMDALARRHADERPGIDRRLVEHKADNEHRARANALRALARGPGPESAGGDLARMLSDDRPTHRLAGVWLAERLLCGGGVADEAWQEMARRIAGLARHEVDAHIRARAKRCSRRLLAEINRGGTPRRTRPTFPRLVREGAA